MSFVGLSVVEHQILTNQAIIMGFLHNTFLDKVSSLNEEVYKGLYTCYQATKELLYADNDFKAKWKPNEKTERSSED